MAPSGLLIPPGDRNQWKESAPPGGVGKKVALGGRWHLVAGRYRQAV